MNNTPLSTRKHILTLLRKSGHLTVDGLADELDISPMGVRQHLALLEKDGLVIRNQVRRPIGRPCYTYSLTEKADRFFPKSYEIFAKNVLNDFRSIEGDKKVEEIFKRRRDRLFRSFQGRIGQKKLTDRTRALVKILNDNGHYAVTYKNKKQLFLAAHNCPIYQIAKDFPQLCANDQRLFTSLLNAKVSLVRSQARGDHLCEFAISEL